MTDQPRRQPPKVLLATLSVRTSAKTGKRYVTGWLGRSKLIGWSGEPDKFGQQTIDLYLQAVDERRDERPARELLAVNGHEREGQAR